MEISTTWSARGKGGGKGVYGLNICVLPENSYDETMWQELVPVRGVYVMREEPTRTGLCPCEILHPLIHEKMSVNVKEGSNQTLSLQAP